MIFGLSRVILLRNDIHLRRMILRFAQCYRLLCCIRYENRHQPVTFTKTIEARVDYGSTVISKEADLLVNAVTCAEADFDAVWEKYTQEILNNGGQQIIDEQRAAYQEGAYRGSYPMGK